MLKNPIYAVATSTSSLVTPFVAMALPVDCAGFLIMLSNLAATFAAFIGGIAVIMILYGAFQFLTAGGDAEKVKGARGTVTYAIIGVAIALLAFNLPAIVQSFLVGSGVAGITSCVVGP